MAPGSASGEQMNRSWALLTDRDRELLKNYPDVDMNNHSSAVARVRDRLQALETDLEILREHHAFDEELAKYVD